METFGRKMRQAVESRRLRLDQVAEATGLGLKDLRALERDDFGALPGDDIVREGLRSFARLVDVDADEVIADYDRERQRWLAAVPAEIEVIEMVEDRRQRKRVESPRRSGDPRAAAEPPRLRPGRVGRLAILGSVILALALAAFRFWSRQSTAPDSSQLAAVAQDLAPRAEGMEEAQDSLGARANRAVTPADASSRATDSVEPVPAIEPPIDASGLSIREHGIGRSVVHHQLVGAAEQFAEGERVWFWTRVEGGTAGESIEHVWLHQGKEARRVPLRLGGARWRTQSYKDLNPGSKGEWAVEARDDGGRVLARREFLCSPGL